MFLFKFTNEDLVYVTTDSFSNSGGISQGTGSFAIR